MTLVTLALGLVCLGWAWLWTGGRNNVLFQPMPRSAPRTIAGLFRLLNVFVLCAIGLGLQWVAGRSVARPYSVLLVAITFGFATGWPIHMKGSSPPGFEYLVGCVAALIAGSAVAMAGMGGAGDGAAAARGA